MPIERPAGDPAPPSPAHASTSSGAVRRDYLTRTAAVPHFDLPASSLWISTWFVLVAILFATRPILPIDESRYVGVAWEMWQRGDFLLPTLNGQPYSDKPPLLFWAIHAGWWLFGVNDWWPRLVPPLFGLANLALVAGLARRFWGRTSETAVTVPLILLGSLGWTFFTTTLTFDMALVCGILLAAGGLQRAAARWTPRAWLRFAFGTAVALLAKGPVGLLFVLPILVLAGWWAERRSAASWLRWYVLAALALAAGLLLVLAWAVPAAERGGTAYRAAIFLHQTADRLVRATAHPQPWWWYLPMLPLALFPFSFLPEAWRRLRRLSAADPAVRFCLSWSLPAVLLLSAISSKQPHYLLGLLPAPALLLGRALRGWNQRAPLSQLSLPLTVLGLFGGVLFAAPFLAGLRKLPLWVSETSPASGLIVVGAAIAGLVMYRLPVPRLLVLGAFSGVIFTGLHAGVISVVASHYDVRPVGRYLAFLEREGHEIAHVGPYHDQFHFEGRLERPFAVVADLEAARAWLRAHPRGAVLSYYPPGSAPSALGEARYIQPFRGQLLGIWVVGE